MTDDLAIRLTRVFAMATAAHVRCAGMVEANRAAVANGGPAPHDEADFYALADEHGLDWNQIVGDTRP